MNPYGLTALLFLMLALCALPSEAISPSRQEREDAQRWAAERLTGDPRQAPFSFEYGGRPFEVVGTSWRAAGSVRRLDSRRTCRSVAWTDPATGLKVVLEWVEYRDLAAVRWVVRFRNGGSADTPIIAAVNALDDELLRYAEGDSLLHLARGESNSAESFAPWTDEVPSSRAATYRTRGGKSSDGLMPFFNLQGPENGVALAIGWSGQWAASFQRTDGGVRAKAGMELTHLKLHPGEEIRTPSILLAFWRGDNPERGNQLLRRTLIDTTTPRKGGQIVFAPICGTVLEADPDGNYERPHVRVMKPLAERGIEVFWSDMDPQQWYPGGFPTGTGTWEPDLAKYPNGLKPVGDAARAAGLDYLLWFEPERVAPGTQIAVEHPQWVLGGANGGLFWLGNPEARKWITDKIDVQITAARIRWVRWDFNMDPLGYWRANDAPDRQGMTEIRHIEGLYAMWDELRRRHPGLLIDICAGGGRRLDIETISRGIPLWHSDLQCGGPHPEADQLQNAALYRWLPLHGCGLFGLEPSNEFRSAFTTGNVFALAAHDPKLAEGVRRSVALQKRLRPYALGDFYPTLPHRADEDQWFAYQFHRADMDEGFLIAYRRAQCSERSVRLRAQGIDVKGRYEVEFVNTGEVRSVLGKELAMLEVPVRSRPGSEIVVYRRI